jgi:hypothetical protein
MAVISKRNWQRLKRGRLSGFFLDFEAGSISVTGGFVGMDFLVVVRRYPGHIGWVAPFPADPARLHTTASDNFGVEPYRRLYIDTDPSKPDVAPAGQSGKLRASLTDFPQGSTR